MKKFIILFVLLLFVGTVFADTIVLDSEEVLSTPQGKKLYWEVTRINAALKLMEVRYRWMTTDNQYIYLGKPNVDYYWYCQDIEVPGTNAECISAGDPFECCTGAGTGTCDDMLDTCFSDVFGFLIRQQDVGTSIGAGLRQLIWNQMKGDILTPGNDGSFE